MQDLKKTTLNLSGNAETLSAQVEGLAQGVTFRRFPASQPDNALVPILSARKPTQYQTNVTARVQNLVEGNFGNLYAKVAHLSDSGLGNQYTRYMAACTEILGFPVTSRLVDAGTVAGLTVTSDQGIPLTAMGEGVVNIVGIIAELCTADGKVFLIEEPETDMHPTALKGVLGLMREAAARNQFIITTHSHIVLAHLGGHEDASVFEVTMSRDDKDKVPKSTVEPIPNTPEAHRRVLEDLGYEMCDYGMYQGWLLLEESSAETIIRDYLIRWFVPELEGKIRTCSAQGFDEVPTRFRHLNRLFVFLHLQEVYRNRAWVILDAGEKEGAVIKEMRETYKVSGWDEDRFLQFEEHDFEKYYPDEFAQEVEALPTGRSERRKAKEKLLRDVLDWIKEDDGRAKEAFSLSAEKVTEKLKAVAAARA